MQKNIVERSIHVVLAHGHAGAAVEHLVGGRAVAAEEAAGEPSAIGDVAGGAGRDATQIRRLVEVDAESKCVAVLRRRIGRKRRIGVDLRLVAVGELGGVAGVSFHLGQPHLRDRRRLHEVPGDGGEPRPPKLRQTSAACDANAASALDASAAILRLLQSAVMKVQRRFSSIQSSCDMVGGFSFGPRFGVLAGAFPAFTAVAFFFGSMAAERLNEWREKMSGHRE